MFPGFQFISASEIDFITEHHCGVSVSECDISTEMEIWEWNYLYMDSTVSCLAYIIPIPEINLIPPRAHTQ